MVQTSTEEERRQQAAARVRAAFSGGLAGGADVLSLAAQLVGGGGERLADELVADPVDPMGEHVLLFTFTLARNATHAQ